MDTDHNLDTHRVNLKINIPDERPKAKDGSIQVILRVCIFFLTFMSAASYAAEGGSHFGALYGLTVPDAENVNPYKIFGARGATLLGANIGLGGYYLVSSNDDQGTGGTAYKYSLHGVEATYHLGGSGGDAFIGGRLGLTKVKTQFNGVNYIFSPYHYGGFCGYDYFLASWLSVGFEGSFLYVQSNSTESGGVSQNLEGFSILTFLVSLQFRM